MDNTSQKKAQTIKDSFENIESDRGKEFYNNIFRNFLNKNNMKIYSRNSSFGAVFAEIFNKSI